MEQAKQDRRNNDSQARSPSQPGAHHKTSVSRFLGQGGKNYKCEHIRSRLKQIARQRRGRVSAKPRQGPFQEGNRASDDWPAGQPNGSTPEGRTPGNAIELKGGAQGQAPEYTPQDGGHDEQELTDYKNNREASD